MISIKIKLNDEFTLPENVPFIILTIKMYSLYTNTKKKNRWLFNLDFEVRSLNSRSSIFCIPKPTVHLNNKLRRKGKEKMKDLNVSVFHILWSFQSIKMMSDNRDGI